MTFIAKLLLLFGNAIVSTIFSVVVSVFVLLIELVVEYFSGIKIFTDPGRKKYLIVVLAIIFIIIWITSYLYIMYDSLNSAPFL